MAGSKVVAISSTRGRLCKFRLRILDVRPRSIDKSMTNQTNTNINPSAGDAGRFNVGGQSFIFYKVYDQNINFFLLFRVMQT